MEFLCKSLSLIFTLLGIINLKYVDADRNASHALLDEMIERFWHWKLHAYPQYATELGKSRYDANLDSYTQQQFLDNRETCERFLEELHKVNETDLEKDDVDNFNILKGELSQYVKGYEWRNYGALNPVNFLEGIHFQWNPKQMTFRTEGDFLIYSTRMSKFPAQVDEVVELMRQAIQLNRTNHKISIIKVPAQIKRVMRTPEKSFWFWPYANRLPYMRLSKKKRDLLLKQGTEIIKNEINPAYAGLKTFIEEEYMEHTRKAHGVWSWDNGIEYYQQCLHYFLGKNISVQEVHDTGLEEVKRIQQLMEQMVEDHGFNGSLRQFFTHIREDHREEFYDRTPIMLMNTYEKILNERINPNLDTVIKNVPTTASQITVKVMENDGPPGMYQDNHFLVNLKHPRRRATFEMLALTLHEANPGHHLQSCYANNLSLPEFRQAARVGNHYAGPFNFPAYTTYYEGWALYSQYLGEVMGLYNDTELEQFGRLSWEMIGALRMVIDTGIHAYKMTRKEAIDMMVNYTALPRFQAAQEVDRYITWPGQACAYKVGEMTLQKWKAEAEDRIGDDFNIRDFNEAVLSSGRAPLEVTRTTVAEYIDANASVASSIILSTFFPFNLILLFFLL